MELKSLLIFLFVAIMATSIAEAQNPLGIVHVNGTLYCTINGGANGPATPPFSNATVQLECEPANLVFSTNVTTNVAGRYDVIVIPSRNATLNAILSSCKLAVDTPLSNCNANLPSVGRLVSTLQFVKTVPAGFLRVTYLIATNFQLN
ncbi:phylloplanin-like isoform X2 [Olea europaea var. sylvestris]|uniref:phylloplanin-like isoform X2 n=1 Tax=Olea europaea var. sylvestris TaxID=158386 RepID=UPI000C1CE44E|nr:phylloplanin-like isoform X2 [Olea europaea var. sylvestris]